MQAEHRSRGRSWSLWALVILLWTIAAAADQKVADIALGAAPQSLAVNPVSNKIYVTANNSNGADPGSVYVVDAVTYALLTVVTVGNSPGTGPNGIAVNSSTNLTYVADYGSNTVSVIDGANNYAVHAIAVGNGPENIAINESTNTIYVTNYLGNTVSAIDGATQNVTTISTGKGPRWLAVNPNTNKVYVTNSVDGTVTVIDGTSNAATIAVAASNSLGQIAVNPQTNTVYVGNNTAYQIGIAVIDGTKNTVTSTISMASCSTTSSCASSAVAVNSATNKVYVSNYLANTITVIDGAGGSVAAVLSVLSQPKSIAIDPATNRVYAANYLSGAITVIDGTTNQLAPPITVGLYPVSLGVTVNPDLIFVANNGSGSLSVINPSPPNPALPTVSITSPATNSVVSQTITVQASATSGLAVTGVQFSVDGTALGSMVTSTPYQISWDSTQVLDGSHTVTAMVEDSAGNTATASVSVTVANGPAYIALFPAPNSNTSVTVAAGGTAYYLLNLTSGNGFNGTVSLNCSGVPATAVCTISPASTAVAADSTLTVTLKVETVPQSASATRTGSGRAPFALAMMLLMPTALAAWQGARRRQALWHWITAGLVTLTILLSCCGGGGSPAVTYVPLLKSAGTASGNYTLTITATSGSATSSVTLTLNVT